MVHNTFIADIDECARGMDITCDMNAACVDINGSFACICNPGYMGNGSICCKFWHNHFQCCKKSHLEYPSTRLDIQPVKMEM